MPSFGTLQACEQRQKPLPVVITAGQRGDSPQFQVVLGRIGACYPPCGPIAPDCGNFSPSGTPCPAGCYSRLRSRHASKGVVCSVMPAR
jgi:hypothetical protein